MKNINVIKSGVGNIGSIIRVLKDLEYQVNIVSDPSQFNLEKKIILPGVGSFDSFIKSLKKQNLFNKLKYLVEKESYSILGICVGMQALCNGSEEGYETGLNFFDYKCKKFDNTKSKVPHIGWNKVMIENNSNLFLNISNNFFYFAHSFFLEVTKEDFVSSTTEYINKFASSVSKKNIYGVQFHPEKSFDQGKTIIKNFIETC